jgi:hypothetical protein
VATVKTFLRRTMHQLGASEAVRGGRIDEGLYFLTAYLAEASLLEYSLLSFLPSRVAAAALSLAHTLLGRPLAPGALRALTGYGPADVAAPARWLLHVHAALAEAGGLYAVSIKYSSPDMAHAAGVAPIVSLTDPRLAACCVAAAALGGGGADGGAEPGVAPPRTPAASPPRSAPRRAAVAAAVC